MMLYIKNMVCDRCKMVVRAELKLLGHTVRSVELGEVEVAQELSGDQKEKTQKRLLELGFALLDDPRTRTVEKVKALIIGVVRDDEAKLKNNLSDYLAAHFPMDYGTISRLFSEIEGTTLEKYFIAQKIERVKELVAYNELSLTEIAGQLNYSSVAYLSSQFKKVTGMTPSQFKNSTTIKRFPLDAIRKS